MREYSFEVLEATQGEIIWVEAHMRLIHAAAQKALVIDPGSYLGELNLEEEGWGWEHSRPLKFKASSSANYAAMARFLQEFLAKWRSEDTVSIPGHPGITSK